MTNHRGTPPGYEEGFRAGYEAGYQTGVLLGIGYGRQTERDALLADLVPFTRAIAAARPSIAHAVAAHRRRTASRRPVGERSPAEQRAHAYTSWGLTPPDTSRCDRRDGAAPAPAGRGNGPQVEALTGQDLSR